MKIQGDIGESFDKLKQWMKENRKPSDRLGESFDEWKKTVLCHVGFEVSDTVLRTFYDEGVFPVTAANRLAAFK